MPEELDVYRDWLGIAETSRPLNHYQLLRLETFHGDSTRIRRHYRKMNAHVRKFASGDYTKQSQELLNELARAMLCLTDATRKREYDATLGRKDTGALWRRTLEEILLAENVIDQNQLAKARSYAAAVGLDIRDALVQQKMAPAEVVVPAYAESQGLPYIELADVGVDEKLLPQIPARLARQHSCVPVMVDEGDLLMASPNPLLGDVEEELRLRVGMPVRTVLCTAASINAMVAECYPRDDAGPEAKKSPAQRKARKPAPRREQLYLSREQKIRRRGMFAAIAFNLTVILAMIFFTFLRGGMASIHGWDFPCVLLLASVAAGVALAVAMMLER